jgi:hypothetical protein
MAMTDSPVDAMADSTGSPQIDTLLIEYACAVAVDDRQSTRYTKQDKNDCRAALVAAVRECVRDARRYRWIIDEPEGARHLLNLLREKKGDKVSFGNMIDRIEASKKLGDAALDKEEGKHES